MPVTRSLHLLGDINLKGIADPARVFEALGPQLAQADMVFANLECCLFDGAGQAAEKRSFYVPARAVVRDMSVAGIRKEALGSVGG